MKKLNKIIFYSIFLTFLIIISSSNVYAWDDKKWPGVNENQIPVKSRGFDYCIYKTGNVYIDKTNFGGGKSNFGDDKTIDEAGKNISSIYSNKTYIFVFDNKENKIKFLNQNSTLVVAAGRSSWNEGWFADQSIYFPDDLYDYLVTDGKLECKKLYFYERKGNKPASQTGSLGIITDPNNYSSTGGYFDKDRAVQLLEKTGVEGTKKDGTNKWCEENYAKFKTISDSYYSQFKPLNDEYYKMSNQTEYTIGNAKRGRELLASTKALNESTRNSISDLKLNEYGSNTKVSYCDGNFESDYNTLIQNMESAYKEYSRYQRVLSNKLNSAKNGGKITEAEYQKEKEEIDNLKKETDKALEEWEKYRSNINIGEEIEETDCKGLLGDELLDDISLVLTWIRIAVPILVIILGTTDFAKAVLSDDQQELKKATGRFAKRCIIAVAIFFIPSIIMYLLSFIDKIYDVSCDIRLW